MSAWSARRCRSKAVGRGLHLCKLPEEKVAARSAICWKSWAQNSCSERLCAFFSIVTVKKCSILGRNAPLLVDFQIEIYSVKRVPMRRPSLKYKKFSNTENPLGVIACSKHCGVQIAFFSFKSTKRSSSFRQDSACAISTLIDRWLHAEMATAALSSRATQSVGLQKFQTSRTHRTANSSGTVTAMTPSTDSPFITCWDGMLELVVYLSRFKRL